MALVNPRASELAMAAELPRYDAYLHYVEAVEHLARGSDGQAMASLRQAAALDTNFAAPKLLLLENGPPRLWDSVATTLEARRMKLSERDQLDLAGLIARKRGDLGAYYDLMQRVVAIVPEDPVALYRLAYAAIGTNHYEAAVEALHEMRRHPGWPNDMYSSWQLDLQAHHLLGDLAGAISEWEQVYARLSNDFVVCTWGVRQYAASGRSDMVDSVVAKCGAPIDAPADLRRLGRRIEVEDELYRWAGREALWHGHTPDGRRMLTRAFELERSLFAKDSTASNGWLAADLAGDWPKAYELMNASFASRLLQEPPCQHPDRRIICVHQSRVRYAVAAAHVGDTRAANHFLAGLEAAPRNATVDVDRAKILLALGRRDEAIRVLRDAVRSTSPANWHAQTTFLDLRGDKWFEALVAPRR
jgi:tetratricopeptide (TPR) repeat protein